jgi:hypothetical protein
MRRTLAAVAAAFLVVALAAPAFGDNTRSRSDQRITAMDNYHRNPGGGHYHGGWYRHHGYYRNYRYYNYPYYYGYYGYPYYYGGYYGRPTRARCDWAYYNDPYFFDRYCRGYSYGYGGY